MIAFPLEPKFLDDAISLYRMGAPFMLTTTITILPEQALAALTSPDSQWWIFLEEGKAVGLAGYERIRPIDGVAEPYLAVPPDSRKQGLGTQIAAFLFQRSIDLNLRRIQTIVLEDAPSRKLLEPLGFKHEGTLKGIRLRKGVPINGHLYAYVKD